MADSMTAEQLAEIRERAESVRTWKAVWGPPIPQLCDVDVPALLAEVERLRAEVEQWRATFGESALRDGLARMTRAEAENGRLRSQLARHLTAWRNAASRARIWRDHAAEEAETVEWMGDLLKVARPVRAAQLDGIEGRVAAAFAAADERGVVLDAMTVAELTRLVMGAVHGEDETDAPTESCDECDLIGRNCVAHGGRPTVAEPSTYSDPAVRAAIRRVNDSA